MKLKITFCSQIKSLWNIIFLSLLYFSFLTYLFGISDVITIAYLALPFIIIFVFPVMIIHINYFLRNTKIYFEINSSSLVAMEGKEKIIYKSTDITRIIIYATPNRLKDTATRSFPFEDYHYVKIIFNNGQEITLTSLLSHNLDRQIQKYFKDVTIDKISNIFPFIRH